MRIVYDLAFFIFGLLYLPYLVITKRYKYGMKDRLGFLPEKIRSICSKNKIIWVHGVSVGEIKAAGLLAPMLRKRFPGHTLLFSTVTHTGNKVAKTIASQNEGVFFLPFDVSFIADKVVDIIKPEIFICMETELWPNLIHSLYRSGAKLVLVNGRISDRSYPRYKKLKYFTAGVLNKFSLLLMQSNQDRERIVDLGAVKEKVFVTGNLKFDIPLVSSDVRRIELRKKLGLNDNEILIVAGSTHKGEEEIIAECFVKLKKEYNNIRLLIAPRHVERGEELEKLISKYGLVSLKISTLNLRPETLNQETIFILDTIGELKAMYAASDIVFIGGSLIKRGGQNPIEPASFGKPVIFGKHTFNFNDVIKMFLDNKAGIEVNDKEGLLLALKSLLNDPQQRIKLGLSAKDTISKNAGSSQKTVDLIASKVSNQ